MNRGVFKLLTGFFLVLGLFISDEIKSQTVWDISTNTGYNNDIAGIGRDDCGGLNQKQSLSVESDAIVTIGRGGISATNAGNPNSISSDLSFFVWGNNNAPTQSNWSLSNVSISGSECEYLMVNRIWKAEETNDVGSIIVRMEADNANYNLPVLPAGNDGSYYLLKDDDGNFTNGGTTALQMFNLSGTEWTVSAGDAEDMYFTFAAKLNNAFEVTIEDGSGNLSITDDEADLGTIDLFAVMPFALDHNVSVDFASANGSATTADSDYSGSSGTATITAGNTSILMDDVVTVNNNNIGEFDESFTVALSSPSGACLGSNNTYTINVDNDDAPNLSINDITVNENVGTATLTVTASNATAGNITFNVHTTNGSATAGQDYTAIPVFSTATITAGSTTVDIDVPITNDLLNEPSENFNVVISGASTAGGATITDGTGVVTITDNDGAPEICIDATTSVTEGTANATINISIDAASGQDITVVYTTSNGTATAGSDYTSTTGTATITAGNTSTSFNVPITNDSNDEVDQTFTVALSSPTNATIGSGCSNTTTIVDNDAPPALCQNISVTLNAGGTASITESQVDNGSNFNGTIASYDTDITSFDCDDVGTVTVTLTVTDNTGQTNSCTADVTVQDTTSPSISCVGNQSVFAASGQCSAVVNGIAPSSSSDNCSGSSITYTITGATTGSGSNNASGTAFNVGVSTVTYTITDASSNTDFCSFTVTVTDNQNPTISCVANVAQDTDSGNCTAVVNNIEPSASGDNCSGATIAYTITGVTTGTGSNDASGTTFNIGTSTVTYTITDASSNTAQCSFDVVVSDNEAPSISCVGNQTFDTDPGNCTKLISTGLAPTASSDNCTTTTITYGISGATTVAAGTSGNANGTTFNIGTSTVTYTINDGNGQTTQCSFDVVISDNQAPSIACVGNQAQDTDSGNCTAVVTGIAPTSSSDNCSTTTITYSITGATIGTGTNDASGTTFNIGTSTVTYTISDGNGQTSQCSFDVVISDNEAPSISCVGNQAFDTDPGDCTKLVSTGIAPTASSDNCTTTTITYGITGATTVASGTSGNANGTTFNIGTSTVTYTIDDGNGQTAQCSFDVVISDNETPTISCVGNQAFDTDPGDCTKLVSTGIAPTASSDNCTTTTITYGITGATTVAAGTSGNANGTAFNIGTSTVTYTIDDGNGQSAQCSFDVVISDNEDPVLGCPSNLTQDTDSGVCEAVVNGIDPTTSDNCTGAVLTHEISGATTVAAGTSGGASGTTFNIGTSTVTYTLTDASSNAVTCSFTVTIEDNEAPVAACQVVNASLGSGGSTTITTAMFDNSSSDNCGIVTYALSPTDTFTADGTYSTTLTVTDAAGNTDTAVCDIVISDDEAPVANCQDITVVLDASGSATITAAMIDNGSTDNGTIVSRTLDITTFDCDDIGVVQVELTVTDDGGNIDTCFADVTVEDNESPVAGCENITIQLDANGDATIVAADVENGSTDNCLADLTFGINVSTFDCSDVGTNAVEMTATDGDGNSNTCTSTVTVEDNVDPTALCQNITAQLDASGAATITTAQIDNGSNDACGIASLALDITSFDCTNIGGNTVELTVTDNNSNQSTCTATVTVEDNVNPVAICQDITVQLDASGDATITAAQIDDGSNDACGIASLALDITSFDCTNIGGNTVELTVTDNNSNQSTCTATVTVEDNVNPVAICQDITVQLDASGDATITAAQIDDGSNDACGIASLALDITSFNCTNIGANTVELTVTDNNSNQSTCTATVTVEDNVNPVATCQDITVQLDASGNATITAAQIDNGSNDACGIDNLALDITSFNCTNTGANTVTLTVTDDNNNQSTCTATVTVVDSVDPQISCPSNITVNNDIGVCGAVVTYTAPVGTDNCSGSNTVQTSGLASGATYPFGTTTNCFEVTDASGNTASCCFDVVVNDVQPTISIADESEDEGVGNMVFTVTLSTVYCQDYEITYSTSDASAEDPDDYTAQSGTLTIPAGSATGTISVPIIDDNITESTETFELNLTGTNLGSISDNQAIGTITDNEAVPSISIADMSVLENAGSVTLTVSLSNPSAVDVTFDYATADIEAIRPDDYAAVLTGSGTISAGDLTTTITITIEDDLLDEIDETFEVNLSTPANATILDNQAIVTILDDDGAPELFITDESYNEGDGTVTFTVSLTAPSGQTVSFDFGQTGITATQGVDYSTFSGTGVSILPGYTSVDISFSITDDNCNENDETFEVNLSNPINATIQDGQGIFTIVDNDATPEICINDITVDESDGTATLQLSLSSPSCLDIDVDYSTSNNSAIAPGDFNEVATGSTTIPAGNMTWDITFNINEDLLDEINETFDVNIDAVSNATIGASCTGTVTITDNDATPCLSIDDVTVDEADGTATFTVSLDAESGQQVGFTYELNDVSTTAGSDFTDPGTVTSFITEGNMDTTIVITIAEDLLDEINETLTVDLSAPTNATFCDNQGTLTITDNDATPCVSISDVSVDEGDGTATFTVELSALSGQDISVDYQLNDVEATDPADATPNSPVSPQTVNIAEGDLTGTITIDIVDDALNEIDETFEIELLNAVAVDICAGDTTAIGTIVDNDTAPCLSINDVTVNEGDGTATFNVDLSSASGQTVTVDYDLVTVSTEGPDHTLTSGTLTFTSGDLQENIIVTINEDLLDEIDETYQIVLSNNVNADICTDGIGTGTIIDNDATPCVSINDVTVDEADGTATFTVTLDAESGQDVEVAYAFSDVTTGTNSTVDALGSGTVTIDEGDLTTNITITINEDLLDEQDETYEVILGTIINGTVCPGMGTGTGTILDNDATPCVGLVADQTVDEADGTMTFTVELDAPSGQTVTVDYILNDIIATNADDYTENAPVSPQTATFLEGSTSETIMVTIQEDLLNEVDETFEVELLNPSQATICVGDTTAIGTIEDNDAAPCFSVADVSVDESGTATFEVTMSAPSGQAVFVDFSLADITTNSGVTLDYTDTTGTITFASGVTSQFVNITLNNDALDEIDETFEFNLSNSVNADICDGQAIGTIQDNDATPCLSIADVILAEADGTAKFVVSLNAPSGQDITSQYTVDDVSTNSLATDYSFIYEQVSILQETLTDTIEVTIIDDLLDEIDETFEVNLNTPINVTICDAQAIGTITDNDATPCISIADSSADESAGTITFTVTTDALSGQDISFDWITSDLTALDANNDYDAAGQTGFVLAEGDTEVTFTVNINEDLLNEIDETFNVTIFNSVNATICAGEDVAIGTIEDNDAPPCISINNPIPDEFDGTADFVISLNAPSGQDITFDFDTQDGSALAGIDYIAYVGDTIIPAGVTEIIISVPLIDDDLYEHNETFNLNLDNAVNADICDDLGTAIIDSEDAIPVICVNDTIVDEGDGIATLTYSLNVPSGEDTEITIADLTSGDALNILDVTFVDSTFTILEGDTEIEIDIPVIDDLLDENDELFNSVISIVTNAQIVASCATGTITIIDNDLPPVICINDVSVDESGSATLDVEIDAVSGLDVTFDWSTSDLDAEGGLDYAISSGTVTIPAGQTMTQINIPFIEDNIDEADEQFEVSLSGIVNATLGPDCVGLVTIEDNDQTPEICISNITVDENVGTTSLIISLSNPSSSDITLDINTADLTATDGLDYTGFSIDDTTITALSTSIEIFIPITDDLFFETTEQVNVILTDAVNAIIDCSLGQVTISDNEPIPCITISDVGINETSEVAEFEICTDVVSQLPIEFTYESFDITATAGLDYIAQNGTLTLQPFDTCVVLSVPVVDDNLLEFTEQFEIVISNSSNAIICDNSAIATINDDKDPSFITFQTDSTSYDESAGIINVVVLNSQPNVQEIKVPLIITGTALGDSIDYKVLATDTVVFAPAEDVHNFQIQIVDDIIYDIDEDIVLTFDLANIENAFAGTITEHVVSIIDNDCDEDDDGDLIPNCDELGDCNDNGIPDYIDFYDPNGDEDGDGVLNLFEDADGDGNPCNDDYDGDGIPNWMDLDSDGDGYSDEVEELNDDDNDGQYDFLDPYDPDGDNDNDCVANGDEDPDGDGDPYNDDTDGDGIPNLNDEDDDNDGIISCDEDCGTGADIVTVDTDEDGIPNYLDEDSDNDGIPDFIEGIIDTDGDGEPNMCDLDSDDDGLPDEIEGANDVDGDGDGNYIDTDSDADGVTDFIDGLDDCDLDGIENFIDADVCDIVIPPAFSPNGDNIRDVWEIYPLDAYPNNTVEIYTRWGQKIFSAAPYQNDWGGEGPQGNLPTGTYFYILDLGDGSDIFTGYVYINRSR